MSIKNVETIYQLSPLQESLLSESLSNSSTDLVGCSQLSFTVRGALDMNLFEKAWQWAVERHPILRTSFSCKRLTKPQQVVFKQITLSLDQHDWRGLPGDAQQRLEEFLVAERQTGFDASRSPLFRLALCRLTEDDYQFVWSYHPLLLDDFSLLLVLKDVLTPYQEYSKGEEVGAGISHSYQDYVRWLKQQDLTGSEDFWHQMLQELDTPMPLAIDHSVTEPEVKSEKFESLELELSQAATAALDRMAFDQGVRIETLLQAAWALILSRYNRDSGVMFGITISCRPGELEGAQFISGALTNTLPVRLRIDPNVSLVSWLEAIHVIWVKLCRYKHESLMQIKERSHVPRELEMFSSRITFEDHSPERFLREWNGCLKISNVQRFGGEYFPLTLTVRQGAELKLKITFDRSRFESSAISRMLEHCKNLLQAFADNPDKKLSELSMLRQEELRQLLVGFNDTATEYPKDKCIHQVFERQVEHSPDAIAVKSDDGQLTYFELNARANQLAHYLRSIGVGPEAVVAICMQPSLEMIEGVLGILKAGGAYAPLEPAYPPERKLLMLEDMQASVLLTQERLIGELPSSSSSVICLDTDWNLIETQSRRNPLNQTSPDNLAYVMYTSGSTGKPKGISVVHRGVVRLVRETNYVKLGPEEVFLQVSPLSFDLSTFEIWGSLLNGARLVLMSGRAASLEEYAEAISKHRVSTLWLTSGLFHQMVDRQLRGLKGVTQLLAGGDVVSAAHVKSVLESIEGCTVINGYGPTENTTFTCCYEVKSGEQLSRSVPIGGPISNTQVYVLGKDLEVAGIRVTGELYTGGDGLARGYMNRPDLTAERFIPNPYSTRGGERLYRTGDLATHLEDGRIEFLGREDNQVKVRGYRIELAEVEAFIKEHPSVNDAVVVVREDTPGDKRLIGYVVTGEDSPVSVSEIRNYLKNLVPDYMVPNRFVLLDCLPLTANGKLDRYALPLPDAVAQGEDQILLPARTSVEEILLSIWQEVLRVEKISIDDNFFSLGGHSLLATQVVWRIREAFQIDVPLRVLFESPTVMGLAGYVESAMRTQADNQVPPITKAQRDGFLPLSFAQERLWFLNQLMPDSPFYNVPVVIRLKGQLNVEAFRRTFTEIVQRHETLRTTFSKVGRQPVQVIGPPQPVAMPLVDISGLPESEREVTAKLAASELAQLSFDLGNGPLLRLALIRLDEDEHVGVLIVHHIVCDNWTIGVLVKEVSVLYEAFAAGKSSPLPELPIQYADFAVWQRKWLQGEALQEQLSYWKNRLQGASPLLDFPTDHPRPQRQSFRGARQSVAITKDLSEALKALSRREAVTLFMTLLAAFKTLLMAYSRQKDILVCTPIANRNRSETEGLIGYFANTVAVRTDLSGNPTFKELLGRVREETLGAYTHQDVPFERLVEELQPERSLSHHPIAQIVFVLQNAPMSEVELKGLSATAMEIANTTAKFDLTFDLWESENGLLGWLEYDTDLFEASTITRMLAHFETVLRTASEYPDIPISDIDLLSTQRKRELISDFNLTDSTYPKDTTIHQLFQQQAACTPDRVAVVLGDSTFTYAELNGRANQLAHYLRNLGVKRGDLIGLYVDHSLEMVVGLLGILKAGAAYVPFDSAHPSARLGFMLDDACIFLILAQGRLAGRLPDYSGHTLCLDDDWHLVAHESEQNGDYEATAEDIAYVIYTSGSTGQPKGVKIQHRALINYICWAKDVYVQDQEVAFPLYSSLAFDLTVTSIYTPLVTGNRIVIYYWEGREPRLDDIIRDNQVGVLKLTPSHLSLIRELDNSRSRIKRLIVGGEALETGLCRQVCESFGGEVEILNEYGPTEATVGCMIYKFDPAKDRRTYVPIGRPAANVQIYVLDERLKPVAESVVGELYISGDGLAQGYLNREELTGQRFINNPFLPDKRMYKTGDLARWLAEDVIECVGRADEQVKYHGYRVELNEIRFALNQHPQVRESVVMLRKDRHGYDVMVAYYVSRQELEAVALRRYLGEKLIEETIPKHFVHLRKMPLTLNGKVNYGALPEVSEVRKRDNRKHVAARTETERVIEAIWSEVLGIEHVSVEENFFELGGHSLLATQVISRVRETLGVEMPLRSVFEAVTIARFAEEVEVRRGPGEQTRVPPIGRASRDEALPLSFAQQRLWFLHQLEPDNPVYNVSTALRLRGKLDTTALEQSLNEIIRRHETLRTTYKTVDNQTVQVIAPFLTLQIPVVDLRQHPVDDPEAEARRIAFEECNLPFNLTDGPVLRAKLLRFSEQDHVALLNMHHIVCDGWSMGILINEIASLYECYSNNSPSLLPELSVHYADFAIWQRQWLQGEVLDAQLSYWRQHLKGAPALIDLPTDHPRPQRQSFRGARQPVAVPKDVSDALKALSQREAVTLFMSLLAAFQTLLMRYSGQPDILVCTPIANRNRPEIEGLIGYFANTLVVRTDLSGNPTFNELLGRVREVTLNAYMHQDVPFERLVEELQPERSLSHHPIGQIVFVLQNAPMSEVELKGLSVTAMEIANTTAKFDLTLDLLETEEGLVGSLEYDTDLFEAPTIIRVLTHFENLLRSVASQPEARLDALEFLSEEERMIVEQPVDVEGFSGTFSF